MNIRRKNIVSGLQLKMSFSNKVVVITGGGSGIGATTAILFSQQGASVAIVGLYETELQEVVEQCKTKTLAIAADLTKEHDVKRMIEETIETFGRIDILVNNAGIIRTRNIPDENFLETYDENMAINARAVVNVSNKAVPYLIESKGNIINISSIVGTAIVAPNLLAYGMSKAAINYFTRSLALQLAGKGVRVNAISPGPVRTGIWDSSNEKTDWAEWERMTPLGKVAESNEIADLILYLASDRAKSATGVNFVLDNGMMIK